MAIVRSCWQTSGFSATARVLLALATEGYAAGRDTVHPAYDHLISVDHEHDDGDAVASIVVGTDPDARPVNPNGTGPQP